MKRFLIALGALLVLPGLIAGPAQQMLLSVNRSPSVVVPNPIYQWDFNENTGTTATDSIASATLDLHPSESNWGTPHTGASSISFTGGVSSNWIDGSDVFNALRTVPFSLSFWINPASLPVTSVFFFTGLGYQSSGAYAVLEDTGVVTFVTNQLGANQNTISSSGSISASSWQHVCITRNGASVKIYVNGFDVTSSSASHINPSSGNGTMKLGAYNTILPYPGLIDQFYIYDVTLSPDQVAQLYINTQ